MAWAQGLYAVDGNPEPGLLWRLQLQSATRNAQGIIGSSDLKVTASSPASGTVNVAGGACVIRGAEVNFQGSYYGYNIGNDPVAIAPTGASARSDMIVAQVEDPTVSGGGWSHAPATDQLIYSRVESGVSSSATQPQVGKSAIPLARIDIPASTSAITQAMIHDLRSIANPITEQHLICQQAAASATDPLNSHTQSTWRAWPNWFSASIAIPSWATTMRILTMWAQPLGLWLTGGTKGPSVNVRTLVGSLATQVTNIDFAYLTSSANNARGTAVNGDVLNVTSIAGTTVSVVPQGEAYSTGTTYFGTVDMDQWSSVSIQYEFDQVPQ